MGILVDLAPVGKDLGVTLVRITTEVQGAFTQGHIPWMDPAGEEKNKPMKTRMPRLKNPESLTRSRGEDHKLKRVLA